MLLVGSKNELLPDMLKLARALSYSGLCFIVYDHPSHIGNTKITGVKISVSGLLTIPLYGKPTHVVTSAHMELHSLYEQRKLA